MAQQVWTKNCSDGTACKGQFDVRAAFIPDDVDICDYCLLAKYDLLGKSKYDNCGDPLSMYPLYGEDSVVKALREAEKNGA